jgi:hypothetical protein
MVVHERVKVLEGGRVELVLPNAVAGQEIEITVSYADGTRTNRKAGSLRGKLVVGPEFDDPIPGMEAYE